MDSDAYNIHFMERAAELPLYNGTRSSSSDELDIQLTEIHDEIAWGEYQYESEPLFGSPSTASGRVLFDTETPLAAFTTVADRPTRDKLARAFGDALPTDIAAPSVDADSQYTLFEKSGISGPSSTRFTSEQSTYELTEQSHSSVTPEEKAKTRAQSEPHLTLSETLLYDTLNELMEAGLYIDMMKLQLQESTITYSGPLSFFGVDVDAAEDWAVRELFEEARVLAGHRMGTPEA